MAEEERIVGFTVEGTPLTKKDLTEMVDNSVLAIEDGKGLTSDDIRAAKKIGK